MAQINPADIRSFRGYQGNPLIKRQGEVEWTETLINEFIKCSQDPEYFAETYMKIIHVDHGLIPLALYDYQRDIIKSIKDNRNTIVTTARQAGKTTSFTAFLCWFTIFHPDKAVAILANKASTAREILGRIQLAYQNLPKWLQQNVIEWNKGSLVLENNSRIIADSTTGDSIRGFSFSIVVIDEAAHIEGWDEFFTSVYPTLSSGTTTKLVMVSTPNGLNHFYATWSGALLRDNPDPELSKDWNGYNSILVTWDKVPGRDEKWRSDTMKALNFDQEKFDQEYNCEFQGSSGTLIAGWKLKELVPKPPIVHEHNIKQYKVPVKADKAEKTQNHSYVVVADTSHGKGLDYSVASVFDITSMPYQHVAVFRSNHTTPEDFAVIIVGLAKMYNDAYVLAEVNDMGEVVSRAIHFDLEYEGLLTTEAAGRTDRSVSSGFSRTVEYGVRTSPSVKNMGCYTLKLLMEQNQLITNDVDTIFELSRFSKKPGKSSIVRYEAETGIHDDTVMSFVLFAWLTKQEYFKELTNINTLSKLRDMTDAQIEADLLPFGFIEDARPLRYSESVRTVDSFTEWLKAD